MQSNKTHFFLASQLEVLQFGLNNRSDDASDKVAGLGVADSDESISDKVNKRVQGSKTVNDDLDVLQLLNIKVLEGGLTVSADGNAELDANVSNISLNLKVGVDNVAQKVDGNVREQLDVVVTEVKLGLEGAILVLQDGIADTLDVAQTGDLSVLQVNLSLNVKSAHLAVKVGVLLGNDQRVKVLLRLEGIHNLVNKLVGVAIVSNGYRKLKKMVSLRKKRGVPCALTHAEEAGDSDQCKGFHFELKLLLGKGTAKCGS